MLLILRTKGKNNEQGVTIQEKTNSLSWERKEKPTHRKKRDRHSEQSQLFHFREEHKAWVQGKHWSMIMPNYIMNNCTECPKLAFLRKPHYDHRGTSSLLIKTQNPDTGHPTRLNVHPGACPAGPSSHRGAQCLPFASHCVSSNQIQMLKTLFQH